MEEGMAEKTYYGKAEAAKLLGICTRTLERHLHDGKLKGALMGGLWRISSDDIDIFYETTKAETQRKLDERNAAKRKRAKARP
jgi:excisionase family DNA binding protein